MPVHDDLLDGNRAFATSYRTSATSGRPSRKLAVVTCMDARIRPLALLGLREGDAAIIRNAGGRVTDDVLRSLAIATAVLGVEHVLVLHHTDCALAAAQSDALREAVAAAGGHAACDYDFSTIDDALDALATDVRAIRSSQLVPPAVGTVGWIYDVASGVALPRVA